MVYFLYFALYNNKSNVVFTSSIEFDWHFIFGLACYQLYFMILLVWFYALMPLWIFIVKRLNIVLLVVLFVFQMAVDYYSSF